MKESSQEKRRNQRNSEKGVQPKAAFFQRLLIVCFLTFAFASHLTHTDSNSPPVAFLTVQLALAVDLGAYCLIFLLS